MQSLYSNYQDERRETNAVSFTYLISFRSNITYEEFNFGSTAYDYRIEI